MSYVSINPHFFADAHVEKIRARHVRRVEAMPPGICPLVSELALLEEGAFQTCGKCVPCRDGLPRLVHILRRIVSCEATPEDWETLRDLAELVRDTSDCVIGYEAAAALLDGMELFAEEYESHVKQRRCTSGAGQSVPCETLCPAHVNVPGYIALVAAGNYAGAVNMVRKDNPFPTACAFVCEHPCELRCRRMLIDAPINIRGIKKYAVDAAAADTVPRPSASVPLGRSVAVVGAGPSGLTCAYFLALMGYRVVVFDAHKKPGGMLRYGIPAYRLPRERLDEDIRGICMAGDIELRLQERIDAARIADLMAQFDAVYVAIGAQRGKDLRIEGSQAKGVVSAVNLLSALGNDEPVDFAGKRVVVVGGGNVAMDCCRSAVRLGATEVSCVYRRRTEDMTALASEVHAALAEGVEFITLCAPVRIEHDDEGFCSALIVQPQRIGPVRAGRPAPVAADVPERRIAADVVVVAIGQSVESEGFGEVGFALAGDRFDTDEYLRAKRKSSAQITADECTVVPVFVGGDCQSGPATVIRAVAAGKVAARNIDEALGYHHQLQCAVEVPPASSNDRTPKGRVEVPERLARERARDFKSVEGSMSEEEVRQECGRCLRCDVFGAGASECGRVQYV